MDIATHVIQSGAKNLPSSRLDMERMPFVDKLVRGRIDWPDGFSLHPHFDRRTLTWADRNVRPTFTAVS